MHTVAYEEPWRARFAGSNPIVYGVPMLGRIASLASLSVFALACEGGTRHDVELDIATGLETSDGIELMNTVSELALYTGPSGGYLSYLWFGDDLPNACLAATLESVCEANVKATLDERVLVDRSIALGGFSESPIVGWSARIPFDLDFGDVPAPYQEEIDVRVSLFVDGFTTRSVTAIPVLVQGQANPEVR